MDGLPGCETLHQSGTAQRIRCAAKSQCRPLRRKKKFSKTDAPLLLPGKDDFDSLLGGTERSNPELERRNGLQAEFGSIANTGIFLPEAFGSYLPTDHAELELIAGQ